MNILICFYFFKKKKKKNLNINSKLNGIEFIKDDNGNLKIIKIITDKASSEVVFLFFLKYFYLKYFKYY